MENESQQSNTIEPQATEIDLNSDGDGQLPLQSLSGLIPTVSAIPTYTPRKFSEQFRVGSNTYYVYDTTNHIWIALGLSTRVVSITSNSTPTPNADITDLYDITALATSPTFGAPTGTLTNGQKLIFRIKDNATARSLTWNSVYVAGGVALPTTTVLSKILTIGFMYNTANSLNKWMCIASAQET